MAKRIWKYPLEITDYQMVVMPFGGEILHVDNQRGALTLWALVDDKAPPSERHVYIIGTGHKVTDDTYTARYVGSAVIEPFVWHVWVR